MEVLHLVGTDEQKRRWLDPLLAGEIRSGFAMTEPDVASSDARNIRTSIVRDGHDYLINGRKWWTTGTADERCQVLVVMGRTNPDAPAHRQQSMVLVPMDTPGVELVQSLPVFGYDNQHGHGEIGGGARAGRRVAQPGRDSCQGQELRVDCCNTGSGAPMLASRSSAPMSSSSSGRAK
jgi:alkylation response protein AidB-like acyl-CoA dehydrogenase